MALNFIEKGKSIMIAIPAGGCESGGRMPSGSTIATPGVPILVGADIVGVSENSFDAGTSGNMTLHLVGVFGNMKLKTGDAPAIGDKLYLDSTNGYLTVTTTSNVWAGWAFSAPATVNTINTVALKLKQG